LSGEIAFELEKLKCAGTVPANCCNIWLICIAGAEMREKMKSIVRMTAA